MNPVNPFLNLRQCAELCGVSVSTLKRKKTDLQAVGAVCDKTGWKVSPKHLQQIGLLKGVHNEPHLNIEDPSSEPTVNPTQNIEIEHLKELLELARQEAATAHAQAEQYRADFERERTRAEAAEQARTELERSLVGAAIAFKELTMQPEIIVDDDKLMQEHSDQPKKAGWWGRLRGK